MKNKTLPIFDVSLSISAEQGIPFLKKMMPVFTTDLRYDFESLKKAFEQADQKKALYFLDKMLGSSLYFGVPLLVECLKTAYFQAKTDYTSINIDDIGLQIELVKKEIEGFLAKEAKTERV